jgi:hypothetical protein
LFYGNWKALKLYLCCTKWRNQLWNLNWLNNFFFKLKNFGNLLPLQDIQLCFICKYHRCDITSHNDILKTQYFVLIKYFNKQIQRVNYQLSEINTYTRTIFKFFRYVFVKKTILFWKLIMWCDVTPVIFAYETNLNILKREQVTKINSIKEIIKSF